jgi:hypothetical protein
METIINLWSAQTKFTNLLLVLEASGGSDPVSAHNKHQPKGQNFPPSLSLYTTNVHLRLIPKSLS